MSDAPREIWAYPTSRKPQPTRLGKGPWAEGLWTPYDTSGHHTGPSGKVHYIRADIAKAELDAAVQAAYEDAAKVADDMEEWALATMNKGSAFPDEYWPSCVAAAIRERGK